MIAHPHASPSEIRAAADQLVDDWIRNGSRSRLWSWILESSDLDTAGDLLGQLCSARLSGTGLDEVQHEAQRTADRVARRVIGAWDQLDWSTWRAAQPAPELDEIDHAISRATETA